MAANRESVMGYLIGEIWIWLLITFVVGVIIGWLVWGRSAPRNTLTDLERKLTNALERCQVCESEKAELAAAVDAAEATKTDSEKQLNEAAGATARLEARIDDLEAELASAKVASSTSAGPDTVSSSRN
ncbi:MAG: hypothetical protein OXC54_11645 [Rhodospirillaceae bacterium]|nr:hypothetical protein [Rhodospirillaceae bacterium]